jgi:hypothetical protein
VVAASARVKSLKGICAPGVIKQTQGNGATQYENNISVNFQIYNAGLFVLFRSITVAERRYCPPMRRQDQAIRNMLIILLN